MNKKIWFLTMILLAVLTGCQTSVETISPSPTSQPVEIHLTTSSYERIEFRFNQPMKPVGSIPSLKISPQISGVEIWKEGHTLLTFEPDGGFDLAAEYDISVNPDLVSADGLVVDSKTTWNLRFSEAQADAHSVTSSGKRPHILRRIPGQAYIVDRAPEIKITFDQEMDEKSVLAALHISPEFIYNTRWEDETLFILPEEKLDPGASYSFRIDKTAVNISGESIRREYTWMYKIKPAFQRATWPTENQRNRPITLSFNYFMDLAQVEDAIVISPTLETAFSWNESNSLLTIHPQNPLPPYTNFTISFQDTLKDIKGDEFPIPEPITFQTPFPILSFGPRSEKFATNPGSPIWITFDRAMDPVTTEAALSITPTVTGTLKWEENTLEFVPEGGYLKAETEYQVALAETATSVTGEPVIYDPLQWHFNSGNYSAAASFGGEGANAQVLDADGRRAIQFVLSSKNKTLLTFDLYRLSTEEFTRSYASNFRGVRGWEEKPLIEIDEGNLYTSWQAEFSDSDYGYGNAQEVLIPEDVPPGIYILNMGTKHVSDQLILILTHNTIAVKQAEDELVSWVTDIKGESLSGIEVSIYARDGELVAQGRTDESGVYRTKVGRNVQPLLVIAREWGDYTVTGLSNEWQNTSGYWRWWWQPAPTLQNFSTYIYTDRPIYKPGQTVYFKAILRHDDDALLRLPASDTPVIVRIRDARDNVVQTFNLQTNYYGTVDGEFQLAEGAMLGEYAVEVSLEGENHRQIFKVQDYRKPDFKVGVVTDAESYLLGDTISVTVDTEYFFGEPVANAKLVIKQYILGAPYYWYTSDGTDEYIWYESGLNDLRGTTDENGRYTFTLPASMKRGYENFYDYYYSWGSSLQRTRWGLEVTVNDGSDQLVSGFSVINVFNARERISLDTHGYFKAPETPFDLDITLENIFKQPVSGRDLTLDLRRWNRDAGDYSTVVQSVDLSTDPTGKASVSLTVEESGYYRFYVQGTDSVGNPIQYRRGIYIFDESSHWQWYGDTGELSISAEQDIYAPGDTTRLVIESTFSGPALLTFERGTTRHQQEIYLEAPLTIVEVPIRSDYAPNIFATVNAWIEQDTTLNEDTYSNQPDSRLLSASTELQVPVTDKTLTIEITPDKENYAPRGEANFTIRVTDQEGNPVRSELSLALVDEAIFSLSGDLSGSIFEAFYAERANLVHTYNSMALFRSLWSGERGGGGGDGGGILADPRSDFQDTAVWLPTVRTNANGEAFISVTLPDNLTTWRMTVKAITADHKVGETVTRIITQQPIVVRPLLPRTLTAGDQVNISAMVHNYSEEASRVDVSIQVDLLDVQDTLTQTVTLDPGEVQMVGWQATSREAGEAQITIQAVVPEGWGDAVELAIPVHPLSIPDVTTWTGDFTSALDLSIPWPEDVLEISTVKVKINRSIAGSLLAGLDYLTGFPYGCVEQTMSKALPNAIIGRAFYRLGVGDPKLQADLPPKINAGLQRLYGYQHNDGGWGWWFDDETDAYQTAWVVFGLEMTAEAGYEVDETVIERGSDWLTENLSAMDASTQAYALYSMALTGHGVLTDTLSMAAEAEQLDAFSQFALALALFELGAVDEAGEIVDALIETAIVQNDKAHWTGANQDGHYGQKTMTSDKRTTALGLSALVKIHPGHPMEGSVVRWLMGQRTRNGWGTTNETSYAILGLTDHLLATELATAETGYRVSLNDEVIASGYLGRGEPVISLEIPTSQMMDGDNQLRITQSGVGRLYYVVSSHQFVEQTEIEAVGSVLVSREYLDPKTNKPLDKIEPGDLIKVKLTVKMPKNGSYILVEDKLPGGLEALNEKLNTNSHEGCSNTEYDYYDSCEPHYYWREYGYNFKEVRHDRVSFFITEIPKGTRTFTYFARATHSGAFNALPAEAWAMYDLTLWGRSASDWMIVHVEE